MARLTEKLKDFSETQKQLEQVLELLKSKETEVTGLRDKVASLQSENQKAAQKVSSKSHAADIKRIRQLEKTVKELEKVIQKRFPNSLSALVLAANSSTSLEQGAR